MKNKKKSGFTLIELIIVIVIICVLGGIFYHNYRHNIDNSIKTAIKSDKSLLAPRMESFYERNGYNAVIPTPICQKDDSNPSTVMGSKDSHDSNMIKFIPNLLVALQKDTTVPDIKSNDGTRIAKYINDRFKIIDIKLLKTKNYLKDLSRPNATYIYDLMTGEVLSSEDEYEDIDDIVNNNTFNPKNLVVKKVMYEGIKNGRYVKMSKQNSSIEVGNALIAGGEGQIKLLKIVDDPTGLSTLYDLTDNIKDKTCQKVILVQSVNNNVLIEYLNDKGQAKTEIIPINSGIKLDRVK